ncbi:MAG: PIG-L family deacetylase [Anaerolineae bacterium]|nr:PIG-L family deacetylase [Anaerolineae bacterium]MDW8172351.1 PIG-L deacetylase family protein [Anaerolineae bacterium]
MNTELQPVAPLSDDPKSAGQPVVVIVAHHDDIEFGVAASVARWRAEGAVVTYVIVTDGGAGSNDPDVTRAELVERRKQEQLAAAQVVGVDDVRFLGYPDGELQPTLALRRDLTRILRQVRPYRVVLQDPTSVLLGSEYINHPDHRAAGEAALYAVFPSSETRPIFPELLAEGLEPHKVSEVFLTLSTQPTHYVDTSAYLDAKLKALACHVSQIGAGEDAVNGALKWTRDWDSETGRKVGVAYAETFRVMKFDQSRPQSEASA